MSLTQCRWVRNFLAPVAIATSMQALGLMKASQTCSWSILLALVVLAVSSRPYAQSSKASARLRDLVFAGSGSTAAIFLAMAEQGHVHGHRASRPHVPHHVLVALADEPKEDVVHLRHMTFLE